MDTVKDVSTVTDDMDPTITVSDDMMVEA
jgi:hypothetical protein